MKDIPLPVIQEILALYEEIGEKDLNRVARKLDAPTDSEKSLGVVHRMEVRKFYAALQVIVRKARACQEASEDSEFEEERNMHITQAMHYLSLAELMKDIFWIQAKDDIGYEAWKAEAVGIRTGWMLVAVNKQKPSFLKALGIQLPPDHED